MSEQSKNFASGLKKLKIQLNNYDLSKKKKKTLILIISGLIASIIIGGIVYWVWSKKATKIETKSQTKEEKIQQLQSQLSQIKNVLDKPENSSQKTKFSTQITEIENKVKNLTENNQELEKTIQKLEQEVKEIKEQVENGDKPNDNQNPPPDNSDPNQNKPVEYVATKINDNTFKYHFVIADRSREKLIWNSVILFLKKKYKTFFKQAFQGALKDANAKFPAYFWKCPPVSLKTLNKPFEFVVIKSDTLNNITQNYSNFQEHFEKSRDNQAVSFFSPSGNVLTSPIPKGTDYKNISQFTKNAPDEQQQALWQEVANKLMAELEKNPNSPRWLNAEGTGVWYLHVRIDKSNRFYSNYKEYEKWE